DKMGFFPYKDKRKIKKSYKKTGTLDLYEKNILEKDNYIRIDISEETNSIKKYSKALKYSIVEKEWKEMEFYSDGIFLGKDEYGRFLIDNTPGHAMMVARSGGGKGVAVVITSLITWKGSTLVNDIKGENWLYTAAYRKSLGHKVFRFEATADGIEKVSCHYNPMVEIRKGTVYEYQDAKNIALAIVSPDRTKDPFFAPSAGVYLTAVILHVLYMVKSRIANLADVYNFITSPQFTEDQKLQQMINSEHNSDGAEDLFYNIYNDVTILKTGEELPRTHPSVSKIGAEMADRADKERSGIISCAKIDLEAFIVPTIARNTAYSDFRISDLMNSEVPMDLYFVTAPNSVDITAVLLKLFITQILYILTDSMELNKQGENIAFKHRLLLLLDELTAIGKVDMLHKAISYIRGWGMKALIIIQDMKQLKEVYGENNSFLGNMSTTLYYTTNDVDTAKYVETRLGNKTEKILTKSYSQGLFFKKMNYSESYVGRPLMRAEEVHTMDEKEVIILSAGKNPIHGKQARWYEIDEFKNRLAREPYFTKATPSDVIKKYQKWEDLKVIKKN
ncbi:MAG: type IV secretory system conjugative DNA transfer family protein, partial [Fusobacterium periodonticum]|nr:type IV secretory system conjugative DNA transfer family protein [Fusobacterium periodonticum]